MSDNEISAATFKMRAFDQEMDADHPQRLGSEAALADYAEKARTAEGRSGLVQDAESGKLSRIVDERDAAFAGDMSTPEKKTAAQTEFGYKAAESNILADIDDPRHRRGLDAYAREQAQRSGKPYEAVEGNEAWGSPHHLRHREEMNQPEIQGTGRRSNLELEVGGAPNRTTEEVAKMIDRADSYLRGESLEKPSAVRERAGGMER